jgi:nucleoside-diphosphate-sugar epimerase
VIAHYRKPPADSNLNIEKTELRVFGDLTESPLSGDHLESVTHIVHLAATLFHFQPAAYYRDNLSISLNLARTARQHMPALRQIVHMSSLAARGPGRSADYPDPERDANPVSDYGRSKLVSEHALNSALPSQVDLTVLRAGVVFSPADARLRVAFRQFPYAPRMAGMHMPRQLSALCDTDVVNAALAALTLGPEANGTYEICHASPLDFPALVTKLGGSSMPAARREGNPPGWLKFLAAIVGIPDRAGRRKPLITRDKIYEMSYGEWVGDPSAFHALTGWQAEEDPNEFALGQFEKTRRQGAEAKARRT